ncbi:hypothetical protein IC762_30190 [Bradyrhizobium genosp. L]|uniref:hypothetical protein n=1 Tax=Bradyrhizobium genosp. L TaxID=83637 RepID=UPI0018A313F4|nr:hypothetical protein [Bradyrhizobium genosp. L]QPF83890.1 hypothetical protein IC762_30190 [Bradyrhizobium genosp. L]
MAKTSDHGITIDEKGQEQPKDKDRAQKATKTEPGHMPPRLTRKEEEPKKDES